MNPSPGKTLSTRVQYLSTVLTAFNLRVYTHFQSYLARQLPPSYFFIEVTSYICNTDSFVIVCISFWVSLNSEFLKIFPYIKFHSLCCKTLWDLSSGQFHVSTTTISYRIVSPSLNTPCTSSFQSSCFPKLLWQVLHCQHLYSFVFSRMY